ncbi:MAG: hypothetical protein JWO62_563 [Acidimicrobiaceae bacterium]|nr:hypothetical protein [Acidimicrobiaceae bacterium]
MPVPVRVTFDDEANAAYVYLADEPASGWRHGKTVSLDPIAVGGMVNVDFDTEGRIIGIEVLDARSVLSEKLLTALVSSDQK